MTGMPAHVLEHDIRKPGGPPRLARRDQLLEDVLVLDRLLGRGLPPAGAVRRPSTSCTC